MMPIINRMALMSGDALRQLQNQIEAVRREAYQDGFDACQREWMRWLQAAPSSFQSAGHPASSASIGTDLLSADEPERARRIQRARGENRKAVEQVFRESIEPLTPMQAKSRLETKQNLIPYSSLRHAMAQLEARGIIERTGDNQWRRTNKPFMSDSSEDEDMVAGA